MVNKYKYLSHAPKLQQLLSLKLILLFISLNRVLTFLVLSFLFFLYLNDKKRRVYKTHMRVVYVSI